MLNTPLSLTHPVIVHNDLGRLAYAAESDFKPLRDSETTKLEPTTFESFSFDGNRISSMFRAAAILTLKTALKQDVKRGRLLILCFLPISGAWCLVRRLGPCGAFITIARHVFSI
jgi:hypothetical protein